MVEAEVFGKYTTIYRKLFHQMLSITRKEPFLFFGQEGFHQFELWPVSLTVRGQVHEL